MGKFKRMYYETSIPLTNDDVLRYGVFLTEDNFDRQGDYTRIRTISYNGKIYYHKMVNGNVVEFKVIGMEEVKISQEDKDKTEMEIYDRIRRQFDWGR